MNLYVSYEDPEVYANDHNAPKFFAHSTGEVWEEPTSLGRTNGLRLNQWCLALCSVVPGTAGRRPYQLVEEAVALQNDSNTVGWKPRPKHFLEPENCKLGGKDTDAEQIRIVHR